jgi:hypothetical protein
LKKKLRDKILQTLWWRNLNWSKELHKLLKSLNHSLKRLLNVYVFTENAKLVNQCAVVDA